MVDRNQGDLPSNFYHQCNLLKFKSEGKHREGFNTPLLTNMTFWNVRIKKEHAVKYLETIGAFNLAKIKNTGNVEGHIGKISKIWAFLLWWANKLTKGVVYDNSKKIFHGFAYIIFLAAIKDPEDERGVELL